MVPGIILNKKFKGTRVNFVFLNQCPNYIRFCLKHSVYIRVATKTVSRTVKYYRQIFSAAVLFEVRFSAMQLHLHFALNAGAELGDR